MKKLLSFALVLVLSFTLAACGDDAGEGQELEVLRVGATAVPHAEVLEFLKETLAEEGIDLQVTVFTDYVTPNRALADGDLDANYFQHRPYLARQNEEHDYGLTEVTGVHIEPMGGYSKEYNSIDELPDGATILHPDAVSEEGRVLALLEEKGLIKLADGVGFNGTVRDIVENPRNFQFQGIEAAMLITAWVDADLAVINTNYALEAGLSPGDDSLVIESPDNNPYVNVLAVIEGNEDNPAVQKLAELLNSDAVRQFIEEQYNGAVLPAF